MDKENTNIKPIQVSKSPHVIENTEQIDTLFDNQYLTQYWKSTNKIEPTLDIEGVEQLIHELRK